MIIAGRRLPWFCVNAADLVIELTVPACGAMVVFAGGATRIIRAAVHPKQAVRASAALTVMI